MITRKLSVLFLAFALLMLTALPASSAKSHASNAKKKAVNSKSGSKAKTKGKEKPFSNMIKDKVAVEGLFTFYVDTVDNSVLMAVKPEQFGKIYLSGQSVSHGDGAFVEGSRMFGTFPFYFKRVGKKILLLEKNIRIRADSSVAMFEAVQSGISDGLISSTTIKSLPDDSTGAILIDPSSIFLRDALNLGYFLGTRGKTGFRLDNKNSYFGEIKSFPGNSEIDVQLHFKTKKPQFKTALQNPYSFFHTFHYSLSELPKTDYVARYADDRVGNFMTVYQDYSTLDNETPYVRYINRFNLKKKNPNARVSEPIEPIVFWIENTTPKEYREAIAKGIEFWQPSFERLGFRNAILAREMPDSADWDPADVRYSTIRWLVAKNYPYTAIGTSRKNPFTGQVYDADIGFVSDAIRGLYSMVERRIQPLSSVATPFDEYNPFGEHQSDFKSSMNNQTCTMEGAAFEAAFGLSYVQAMSSDFEGKSELTREYINQFLTFVIAHEVGHTLGFRHNFMASTVYTREEINDPAFTNINSAIGTVMDYPAPNIAGPGVTQGDYYPGVPGPYDNWVIEYSYSDFQATTPDEESDKLESIAMKSSDPKLLYATDEDTFGYSMKSIDPRTNIWDVSDDPIAHYEHELELSREIWLNLIDKFEQPGVKYQKIRNVFGTSLTPYIRAALTIPKYVGGIYHERGHIGDPNSKLPFTVVPASEQRRAIKFMADHLFAAEVFELPSDLLNKLQGEDLPDFAFSVYSRPTVDYPLHKTALQVQQAALSRVYSPYVIGRLLNNTRRVKPGTDQYTMFDMFTDVRRSIWGEIVKPENVNSFRRQLQLAHLTRIINIYLSKTSVMPTDARTLAANDLQILESAGKKAVRSSSLDGITVAHFQEVLRQIKAAKAAKRKYSKL